MPHQKQNRRTSHSPEDLAQASIDRYNRRLEHLARRQQRYAERDFAVWAEDSWGSDDPDLGSRNSVRSSSGGRVQSNRSRY